MMTENENKNYALILPINAFLRSSMVTEITISSHEYCPLESGTNALIIYIQTKNNSSKSIHVEFEKALILTEARTQVEQLVWLSGHFIHGNILPSASVESGLCFDSNQIKKLEDGCKLFVKLREKNSEHKKIFIFTILNNQWVLSDYQEEHEPKGGTIKALNRHMKNRIERFELLEEEIGIEVRNISVISKSDDHLEIAYEHISTANAAHTITIYAIDEDGWIIGGAEEFFNKTSGSPEFTMNTATIRRENILERIEKLRILPKRSK